MTQPVAQLLDQRIDLLPQRKKFQVHVLAVEFSAHAFVVNGTGYSGPRVVPADASIDFGAINYPQVHRGNDCIVEKDDRTGVWHATAYVPTNTCVPLTAANVPNVPLPSYTPSITLAPPPVFSFPPLPGLPAFPPFTTLPPFVPPVSLPPTGFNTYDFGDWLPSVLLGTTVSSVGFEPNRAFTVNRIACECLVSDCTLNIYTGTANPAIIVLANVDGTWTVERHNPATAALISTWTSGVVTSFVHSFTGTSLLSVAALTHIKSELIAGSLDVTDFFWSCGGVA